MLFVFLTKQPNLTFSTKHSTDSISDVFTQQHDDSLQPSSRKVPDGGLGLQGQDVHEGGGGPDTAVPDKDVQVNQKLL